MKVSPPAGHLPRKVNLHALGSAHKPDQRPLGQHFPAADAGALRDMFPLTDFAGHETFYLIRSAALEIQVLTPVFATLALVLD